MSKIKMNVTIAGVEWKNPVTCASGTFGSGMEYGELVDLNLLGAVTTKGVADVPWPGNAVPRIAETASGMMNAIGLQNPGIDTFIELGPGKTLSGFVKKTLSDVVPLNVTDIVTMDDSLSVLKNMKLNS